MLRRSIRALIVFSSAALAIGATALPAAALDGNDDFGGALEVGSLPYEHAQVTTGASTEPGEPVPSCSPTTGATVWYRLSLTGHTALEVVTFGSKFDTVLAVHRGTALGSLTEVACNDDHEDTGSLQSRVSLAGAPGEVLQIQVGGYMGSSGRLRLSITGRNVIPGDDFAQAVPITGLPFNITLDSSSATTEQFEPNGYCGPSSNHSLWFRFDPATPTTLRADTFGSEPDTLITAYRGSSLSNLELLGCNDDTSQGLQSKLAVQTTPGEIYYLQVGSWDSGGTVVFNAVHLAPPANDALADATEVQVPDHRTASSEGATIESNEMPGCYGGLGATIWFRWTAQDSTPVYAHIFGSDFYGEINIYEGTTMEDLVSVACDDFGEVGFVPSTGRTYLIQVGGWGGDSGTVRLRLTHGVHQGAGAILAGGRLSAGADDDYRTAYAFASVPFVGGGAAVDHDEEEGGYVVACGWVVIGTCVGTDLPPAGGG